jgi:hypothetical protein
MSLSTGDVIDGKYRIVRLIGEGGMGAVYEGENIRIHRTVAIKVLHSGVAENQDAVQRFEREAQAAGRIGSEHIVEVLDLGNLPDGDRFMVMEFMDGDSLSARIQARGRLTAQETYPVARQMLEGLAAAHGAGIIHRDLKPDNVFLLKRRGGQVDFVKLLDFGISKFSALSGESGFSMTRTGAVMGTPYYMSPEQAKGAKGMDLRADLYAIGVILYECVTGRVPFNADTFNELLFKIVLETPQPIEQVVPDSDPQLNAIITKAMAREPAHRYQTAKEFQSVLDDWASGAGVPANVQRLGVTPAATGHMPAVAGLGASRGMAGSSPGLAGSSPGLGGSSPGLGGSSPGLGATPGAPRQGSLSGTGTPGTWANTPAVAPVDAAPPKRGNGMIIGASVAGLLALAGVGVAVTKMGGGDAAAASSAPAAQPAGPSIEDVKAAAAAAAAEEAKRVAAAADEKIHKAEEEARAAEARARAAEANASSKEKAEAANEAKAALERVAKLKALAAPRVTPAKPAPVGEKPAPAAQQQPAAPKPDPGGQPSGRKIRTEL